MTKEIWRPVVGHEGDYEVSNLGRVRSLDRSMGFDRHDPRTDIALKVVRFFPGRELKLFPKSNGYIAVSLGFGVQAAVHVLVLRAFIGEPAPDEECLHWDRDKSNNRLSNLRWGTGTDNQDDSSRHGTRVNGERVCTAKLTPDKVRQIRKLFNGSGYKSAADEYGVSASTIRRAAIGKTWGHVS